MGLTKVTPVRRQYLELKARYPDAILLFRLGDFYETFDEDARLVARELEIALTSKPMGSGLRVPLAGVPVRSVEQHLARLVGRGHRVAICEQLEQPSAARKLVRRGVVRVVSPGTALEPALLEAGEASACAAVWIERGRGGPGQRAGKGAGLRAGLAAADVSTGACHLAELAVEPGAAGAPADESAQAELWRRLEDQLARLGARELLVAGGGGGIAGAALGPAGPAADSGLAISERPPHAFGRERAERAVERQFGAPAAAFGLEGEQPALRALGALLEYLGEALPDPDPLEAEGPRELGGERWLAPSAEGAAVLPPEARTRAPHLGPPVWLDAGSRLDWDRTSGRALGIVEGESGGGAADTLLGVVDRCGTAPGRRWLRQALAAPLLEIERIAARLDRVEALQRNPALRRAAAARLRGMGDLERLLARAGSGVATPRQLAQLASGLIDAEALAGLIHGFVARPSEGERNDALAALAALAGRLGPAPDSARRMRAALDDDAEAGSDAGVVRAGVDAAVDRGREAARRCRERLAELETTLRAESGIDSLRLEYHRTFGYQIELSRSRAAAAPGDWERRQSLRDRERFTEPRLRAIAAELDEAEDALGEAERACVERLRRALVADAAIVRERAGALARLDAACSLASVAAERAWTRPVLDHSSELEIEGGRHPIVEARAAQGGFVPNDLRLAADGRSAPQLLLVTGPNMAGKSTYLRQAALIVVLAQAGSYVPAERARVGLVDRIFARVGAHDELARGRSTFMVEMLETARLLHGSRERSLVLLDEIGRGTSTWDGMAIARAVVEELTGACAAGDEAGLRAGRRGRGPRTMFATHFHELTALAGALERVENAAVQVEECENGELVFPYRVRAGAADRSYGVQVARQAGLPARVIERAAQLLGELERSAGGAIALEDQGKAATSAVPEPEAGPQLMLMPPAAHPILSDLADLDIDGLTPLEAISALYALRDQAQRDLRAGAQRDLRAGAQRDLRDQAQRDLRAGARGRVDGEGEAAAAHLLRAAELGS